MNDRLFQRAASQHALFTAVQARECGVSRSALARSVARGRLAVPHPGVFAVAGAPGSWERRLMAVLLAVPSAVASHRSAARLWQLVDPDDDTVEVTVPRNHGPRPAGVVVHRSGDLTQAQVSLCRGVWATNPLRTIVDLGAVMPAAGVEDALDRGLIRRLYSVAGVEWMLAGLSRQGRHGTGVLGRVLDRRALGSKPPDGMLEPRMARLLRSAGLPCAEFQYVVRHPVTRRFLARVDFAYPPPVRLAIEVDGFAVHGTPRAMEKDFVRQNGLVPYRWHVLRFTWKQVVRQPAVVASTISESLAALSHDISA